MQLLLMTVQATLDMETAVLIGATLSFIGLSEDGIAEWEFWS